MNLIYINIYLHYCEPSIPAIQLHFNIFEIGLCVIIHQWHAIVLVVVFFLSLYYMVCLTIVGLLDSVR